MDRVRGLKGLAALTKDRRIRYITAERDSVRDSKVILFALANANLGFPEMAGALLSAMPRIHEVCQIRVGGAIWVVQRDGRLDRIWP